MAIFNVHAGHAPQNSSGASGAVGLIYESIEDRKVKDRLITLLKNAGHTVYDCTCDDAVDQNTILSRIVKKCNSHTVDLDISIHLNSGRNDYKGDGYTGGSEVYGYDNKTKSVGSKISDAISKALVIKNRGYKTTKNLYVLNSTKSPSVLIECCFVDDADDVRHWNTNKCAEAIFLTLCEVYGKGKTVATVSSNETNTVSSINKRKANVTYKVKVGKQAYAAVVNRNDYAGVENKAITDIAAKVDIGEVFYQVHVKGKGWLGYVSGYDFSDDKNGYAGNGKTIDGFRAYSKNCGGKLKYRVSTISSPNYLSTVTENTDYAGVFGKEIDKIQMWIE